MKWKSRLSKPFISEEDQYETNYQTNYDAYYNLIGDQVDQSDLTNYDQQDITNYLTQYGIKDKQISQVDFSDPTIVS